MISKTIAACVLLISASGTFLLNGCSDTSSTLASSAQDVRVDEAGLIAAVGAPVVSETKLDDGRSLHFRASGTGPAFKLEFRQSPQRVNLAWEQYSDSPAAHELNKQNSAWAVQVLNYATGSESTSKVVGADKPFSFTQAAHKINVIPGDIQTLVTISPLQGGAQ